MDEKQKRDAETVLRIAAQLPQEALRRLLIYGEGLRDAHELYARQSA